MDPHREFTVVDVETTGLDPAEHRVVEVAAVRLDAEGAILRAKSTLVRPGIPIPATTSAVHGITDGMVRGAPDLREALASLDVGGIVVAHNAAFDVSFLSGSEGVPSWADVSRICTWRCAQHLIPDAPSHRNGVLFYHLGLQMPGWFGERPAFHAALPDAVATALIFRHLLTLAPADELMRLSGVRPLMRDVPFGKYRGRPWSEMDRGFLRWCLDPDRKFGEDVTHAASHWLSRR